MRPQLTYNVLFHNGIESDRKGFHTSFENCLIFIKNNNGSNKAGFAEYHGGIVQIICNETGEKKFQTIVK